MSAKFRATPPEDAPGGPRARKRRRWPKIALAVGATITLLAATRACQTPPTLPQLTASREVAMSNNAPVLQAGDQRDKALWNDPSVLKNADGSYTMYATTSVGEPFQPPILPFRLTSRDGRTWKLASNQPLLQPQGGFTSVETPSVVQFKGVWHMFFTGTLPAGTVPPMAIGHATSSDGMTWKFDPALRISATGNVQDWNGYLVGEPGAVVVNGVLRVYFSAVGARKTGKPQQLQTIGLVESSNGVNFSSPRQAFRQTSNFPPEKGFAGYSTPAATMVGNDLHLFYSVVYVEPGADPEWNQVAIGHAVSKGGTSPFVEAPQPVLSLNSTSWATGEILAPSPLYENGRMSLWFGGHVPKSQLGPLIKAGFKGPSFGIGYATIPVP